MGHLIRWDNAEKTVVLQEYVKPATKDDLYHLAKKSNEMLSSVSHTVHLIIDERNIDLVLNTPDINFLEKMTPTNQGAVVMIVPPAKVNYKRLIQNMARQVAPNAFDHPFFANDVDEARRFLQELLSVSYDDVPHEETLNHE